MLLKGQIILSLMPVFFRKPIADVLIHIRIMV